MTTAPQGLCKLKDAAWRLDLLATLTAEALDHIARELVITDGYASRTMSDGMPSAHAIHGLTTGRGDDNDPQTLTPVEQAAHARWTLTAERDQIRDDIDAVIQLVDSLGRVVYRAVRLRAPIEGPKQCDGRDFAGSAYPWVQHSRDEMNGWLDPTCRDAADTSGLCPRCRIRERRWREANGLTPREANASTPAAAVGA